MAGSGWLLFVVSISHDQGPIIEMTSLWLMDSFMINLLFFLECCHKDETGGFSQTLMITSVEVL